MIQTYIHIICSSRRTYIYYISMCVCVCVCVCVFVYGSMRTHSSSFCVSICTHVLESTSKAWRRSGASRHSTLIRHSSA